MRLILAVSSHYACYDIHLADCRIELHSNWPLCGIRAYVAPLDHRQIQGVITTLQSLPRSSVSALFVIWSVQSVGSSCTLIFAIVYCSTRDGTTDNFKHPSLCYMPSCANTGQFSTFVDLSVCTPRHTHFPPTNHRQSGCEPRRTVIPPVSIFHLTVPIGGFSLAEASHYLGLQGP